LPQKPEIGPNLGKIKNPKKKSDPMRIAKELRDSAFFGLFGVQSSQD
jgi:hypothetical protein